MKQKIIWTPTEKQKQALIRSEFEILFGGARGGGKTAAGIAWLMYDIGNPLYRALVVRRNADDLKDWIDRARTMYAGAKGEVVGIPAEIRFPSGAVIRTGHLRDENAYEKYQGHEYQKMVIEELTHIPRELDYLKLIASCRSTVDGITPQVFATTNPGNAGHCVPYGEILTLEGWKDIKDVRLGDFVATVGEDDTTMVYAKVKQLFCSYFKGNLIQYKNVTNFILCTPNHKIARITETKNQFGRVYHGISLTCAENLSKVTRLVRNPKKWKGICQQYFYLPFIYNKKRLRLNQPHKVKMGDFCEFLGWFLSEGYVVDRDKAFGISQTKKENREKIKKLLQIMRFKFLISKNGFLIHSPDWYFYLKQFGKCRDKFIPQNIKNLLQRYLKKLLKTLLLGDGHREVYYTTSRRLADDVQEIALKSGFNSALYSRQREKRCGLSYEISIKGQGKIKGKISGWIEEKDKSFIPYEGNVYCLGISQLHRFFIRQNGKIWLSGNSWVRKRFIDIAPAGHTYIDSITGRPRVFIPAKIEDNPYLMEKDPMYVKFLDGLPDGLRQAWRDGSWDNYEIEGAYYGAQIRQAEREVRITNVPYVMDFPVDTYWDLGVGDSTAIWFVQQFGNEIRLIDCYDNSGEGLSHYAQVLHSRGYVYGKHVAPHDIEVKELGSGKTRKEVARNYGIYFQVAKKLPLYDGIDAVRRILNRCWFDREKCAKGLESLRNYRKEYDDKLKDYKLQPVHDFSSHYADALRYMAISLKERALMQLKNEVMEEFDRYSI